MTPKEVKAEFKRLLSTGVQYIPFGSCDNFDPLKGCMGHEAKPDLLSV
jgi:hypothetical protein